MFDYTKEMVLASSEPVEVESSQQHCDNVADEASELDKQLTKCKNNLILIFISLIT